MSLEFFTDVSFCTIFTCSLQSYADFPSCYQDNHPSNLLVISADFCVLIKISVSLTKPYYAANMHNRLKCIVSLQLKPYSTVLTILVIKVSLSHEGSYPPTFDLHCYTIYVHAHNMTPLRIQAHCVRVMEKFLDISYLKYSVKVKGVALRTSYGTLMQMKMYTKQNDNWAKIISIYFWFNGRNVQKCQWYLEKNLPTWNNAVINLFIVLKVYVLYDGFRYWFRHSS